MLAVCVQVGDRIISINGESIGGSSHSDIVAKLKNCYGNISLQVRRDFQLGMLTIVDSAHGHAN